MTSSSTKQDQERLEVVEEEVKVEEEEVVMEMLVVERR